MKEGGKGLVKVNGVGTNKIDFEVLDEDARERVMECLRKNGKISIIVSDGKEAAAGDDGGFVQKVD